MLSLFSLFILTFSGLAQSPQMPTEVFKAAWKELETPQGSISLCLDSGMNNFFLTEGMSASLSCLVKCSKGREEIHQLKRNFIPSEQGMRKGDGNLWASLSTTLKYWSEESCIHYAAELCSGLNKIEAVETQGLKSGDWNFSGEFSCKKSQENIYSPFDSKIKKEALNPALNNISAKNPAFMAITSDWRKSFGMSFGKKINPVKDCSKKVSATFCFGDCMDFSGGVHRELLASPVPLGSDQYEFCMDSLIEKVKEKSLPRSIVTHLCETEILSTLKERSVTGLTCASSRLETTCSDLMK